METDAEREARARKERAAAIRNARDARNAQISGEPPPANAEAEKTSPTRAAEGAASSPNYVDLIDRRMRETKEDNKSEKPSDTPA